MIRWLAVFVLLFAEAASAQSVTWPDTSRYPKPRPINVAKPVESGATVRYYVDLTAGAGTLCSLAEPCRNFTDLVGKAGMSGGPAYVEVSGTGAFGTPAIFGSPGAEIVIRPRGTGTANITGNATLTGAFRHVIFDGGQAMRMTFTNASATAGTASIEFRGATGTQQDVTFQRVLFRVTGAGDSIHVAGTGSNLRLVNVDFDATGSTTANPHRLVRYTGNATLGAWTGLYVQASTLRNSQGYALDFAPTQGLADFEVSGNVGYNLGVGSCGTAAACGGFFREILAGGSYSGFQRITNNVIWNTGGAQLVLNNLPTGAIVANNTHRDWAAGASAATNTDSAAIKNNAFTTAGIPTVRNSLFQATGNDANGNARRPFPGNSSHGTNNGCVTGNNCGTPSVVISTSSFSSVTVDNRDYLRLASGSTPINAGTALAAVTTDMQGKVRTIGGTPDMGAHEFGTGSGTTRPNAPGGASGIDGLVGSFGPWQVERPGQCQSNGTALDFESRSRPVVRQPGNGGAPLPVLSEQRTNPRSCTPPPPSGGGLCSGNLPCINIASIPADRGGFSTQIIGLVDDPPTNNGEGASRFQSGMSHFRFDDPIIYPNQQGASHLHMFFGNTCVDYSTITTASLLACPTVRSQGGIANRSAYWFPAMIDITDGAVMPISKTNWYYKSGYDGPVIKPPNGLRWIGGKLASATGPDPDWIWQKPVTIYCQNNPAPREQQESIPPNCGPGNPLAITLGFQNCWDGVNLDSPDHRSHMAKGNSGCPPSHPVVLPSITLNVYWDVPPGRSTANWRLSSDGYPLSLPGGYTVHADIWLAWDEVVKDKWYTRCVQPRLDCHGTLGTDPVSGQEEAMLWPPGVTD